MTYQRRPHQKEAISDILSGFKQHNRGQYVSACGTGKTLTSLWAKEDLNAQRTLVLVPSLALLSQYANEWRKHQSPGQRFAILCVCSDGTVGLNNNHDEIHFSADDLEHEGLEVTSNINRITSFLKQEVRQVIFSTYHSSHLIETAQSNKLIPSFDLTIADEAHRCTGDPDSFFAIILDEERIRAEKRLFVTATPRIYKLKKDQVSSGTSFVDMSSEEHFGPRFHTLTFGEAIRRDLLSDYQIVIMMIDEADIQMDLAKDDATLQAAQVGLLKAAQQFGLRKIISFHSYVKNADDFAQSLPQIVTAMPNNNGQIDLTADFVSGKMTTQIRKQKLKALGSVEKGQCHILSNARCLSEGVDVPDLDGLAFINPRSSEIDIIQALGRVIRKHETKTHGTIVLPVFVSKDEDINKTIKSSHFQPVFDVLSAIRAHDADFESALNAQRQSEGSGKTSDTDPFAKIKIVGTGRVVELSEVIRPIVVQTLTNDWEIGFGAGKAYFEVHGHCNVNCKSTWPEGDSSGFRLGRWLASQRSLYKQGILSDERIKRLESIGINWNPFDNQWEKSFDCANAYFEKHGHCNATQNTTWPENDPNGIALGSWIIVQRMAFKQGKLTDNRKERLEAIGIIWGPLDNQWENGFDCAKAYFEVHGHCNTPTDVTWPENDANGIALGSWINSQRMAFKQGKLTDERKEKLEVIGIIWNPYDNQWEASFDCANAYFKKHGHCNAPQNTTWPENDPNGIALGSWIGTQRKAFNQGKLPDERKEKLEVIGIIWNPYDNQWEASFDCANAYFEKHGHCNVHYKTTWPEDDSSGFALGSWIVDQRKAFKQGKLTDERKEKLEVIGIIWNPFDNQWEKSFDCANAYFKKHGHCNATQNTTWPENDANGIALGSWIGTQRKAFNQGKLSDERREKLESIGIAWPMKPESTQKASIDDELIEEPDEESFSMVL